MFNAAALAAASALIERSAIGAALVFGLGAVASLSSLFAIKTQHIYYRAARDRMRRIESYVNIPEGLRTDRTTSLGGPRRIVSVNQVITLLFSAIMAADLATDVVVAFL